VISEATISTFYGADVPSCMTTATSSCSRDGGRPDDRRADVRAPDATDGFDDSRASERRDDPSGWRFPPS